MSIGWPHVHTFSATRRRPHPDGSPAPIAAMASGAWTPCPHGAGSPSSCTVLTPRQAYMTSSPSPYQDAAVFVVIGCYSTGAV